MDPQKDSDPLPFSDAPGCRLQLLTRFEAFCPGCGYSLQGIAVVLLSVHPPDWQGDVAIAAVCTRCYQDHYAKVRIAASVLADPLLAPHVEITHGVRFLCPRDGHFCGHTAANICDHLRTGAPLYQQLYYDPPPPLSQPDAGQGRLEYDPPPTQDEPAAYDPPCPADVTP